MFIIYIPEDVYNIKSKPIFFVENRYTVVWTTSYYHAKRYDTQEKAEADIKEYRLKKAIVREV